MQVLCELGLTLTVFQLIFPTYTHAGVQMLAATYAAYLIKAL